MADQYSTGDSSVDLTTSDSKKRPLDGAGDGRPSYKRSNLGGKHSCESFPIGVWKLRSLWGVLFCHVALRRQVEIFTPFHLSAVCRSFMAWKIELSGVRNSPTSATTTRVLNCERSVKKLRFYAGKIGLVWFTNTTGGEHKQSWIDLTPLYAKRFAMVFALVYLQDL